MKREVCYVCRLLFKKTKQLLPLVLVIGGLVFITKIQITRSHNGIFYPVTRSPQGLNTSIKLATRSPASRELSSREPSSEITQIKQANNSRQGETSAAKTRDVCKKFQPFSHYVRLTVRWSKANDLLFCPIYKVGTTFWRRVFMIQREKKYSNLINPYLLPFDKEYAGSDFQRKGNVSIEQYKVMFTRDPYNRLFSFYVDKMLAPNPYFWKSVGVEVAYLTRQIRREKNKRLCGHDVTFREFIKYVIYTLESRKNIDPHWIEMEKNCQPCEMNYDFIGKMENFSEDSKEILQKLGLTSMADFLDKNGKEASVDDAIRDTLSQPFTFRAKYRTCMSFQDAILRAWKKLQIRGLIGEVSLDGLIINEKVTKLDDVISRARAARNQSTALERKEIKNKMFKELWDQVDTPDMYKLKKLYAKDFKLFGYDDMPSTLFSKRTVM